MRFFPHFFLTISIMVILPITLFAGGEQEGKEGGAVNIYSHRHYEIDRKLFEQFTEKTGIEVNVVNADSDELIQRLKQEGEYSPADLLITADVARLVRAQEEGLLQGIKNPVLEERIPSHLREPEGHWFGLTKRARVIVYHQDRVAPAELSSYEALTGAEWKGRIAIRSSSNIYNQSLLASIIANKGDDYARQWAEGIVANVARDPQGNDRDQMKAVAAGQADLAVVNTYYVGRMLNSDDPEEVEVAKQIGVFFPNQEGRGTHVNISGAGVTAHAPNRQNAEKLLEFLSTEESQRLFAQANYEYPVVQEVPSADVVSGWGDFKEDTLNLTKLGEYNAEAVRIFDRAGWK